MRVLVVGASGVIGRELVPRLVAAGHAVMGTTRSERGAAALQNLGATVAIFDARTDRRSHRLTRPRGPSTCSRPRAGSSRSPRAPRAAQRGMRRSRPRSGPSRGRDE
ncbi:MAG TPA: NAD-dependent epimerase/dehydratase family protein [Actinotalea caeni]|uniref:NAD-dependent epimerase/dehydratase family protein n=1 Tax=Actinotalea caeni TaxID=1348467 RepID=UPI002B4B3355|nr:NAD-dependent epimerase/dehydratase family protein [Actinotalea caeni]HLV56292.1 NAD-dependent epimerase/dehydratase family protein [Actinotalea caeni]